MIPAFNLAQTLPELPSLVKSRLKVKTNKLATTFEGIVALAAGQSKKMAQIGQEELPLSLVTLIARAVDTTGTLAENDIEPFSGARVTLGGQGTCIKFSMIRDSRL